MTDIVDKAVESGHPGHIQAAEDHLEFRRGRRDALGEAGFSTARNHEEYLEDARTRLEAAMSDDPSTVEQARRNRDLSRLADVVDGITVPSDDESDDLYAETVDETDIAPAPATETENENPSGAMFYRKHDRYDNQPHRGL